MITTGLLLAMSLVGVSVDEAIALYENGDIPGAIDALEEIVAAPDLSFDERLRAWDRLGSAYFAMGRSDDAGMAYLELLKLDVHYDLSPRANPRLRALLGTVRDGNMAQAEITSFPDGALVTLDGELMGVTPITLDGLLAGEEYEVSVYSSGFADATRTLLAQAGQSHPMSFSLTPSLESVASTAPDSTVAAQVDLAAILGSGGTGPSTQGATPATTADLVNILTSGGGFDMAALAGSGALNSQRASTGIAGAERFDDIQLVSGTDAQAQSSADPVSTMVFFGAGLSGTGAMSAGEAPGSSRTGDEIMEVLTEKRGAVSFIYNKHLRSDPMLMGTVLIEMVIEPSGRVSSVNILGSNTYNPAFELELARTIETWRFGAVDEDEDPLTVQYPFTFSQTQ
ncbi:MAG: TonB family protein [Candidatus Fermentibacter sp.]|nr:TonB family protein [Candidatus Fermentibacter sp.]